MEKESKKFVFFIFPTVNINSPLFLFNPSNGKFVDNSGRVWKDETYVQMLVRTNLATIARAQLIKTLVENEKDLARVSADVANTCPMCKPWSGKVVSLTGATKGFTTLAKAKKAGLFHPNCLHRLEYMTDTEIEKAKKQKGKKGKGGGTKQKTHGIKIQAQDINGLKQKAGRAEKYALLHGMPTQGGDVDFTSQNTETEQYKSERDVARNISKLLKNLIPNVRTIKQIIKTSLRKAKLLSQKENETNSDAVKKHLNKEENQKEKDAIEKYTDNKTNNYNDVNSPSRNNEEPSPEIKEQIRLMNAGLASSPKYDGTTWRGFTADSKLLKELDWMLHENGIHEEESFMSTSYDLSVAIGFATRKKNAKYRVIWQIIGKSGVCVEKISKMPQDKEVLFPTKTKLKVLKVIRLNSIIYVKLKEV